MKTSQQPHTHVVALRPWPFGPPLRGRAPRHDVGMPDVPHATRQRPEAVPSASAPVGGLAPSLLLSSLL